MLRLLYTSFIKHQATRKYMKNNPKNHESFPPQKISFKNSLFNTSKEDRMVQPGALFRWRCMKLGHNPKSIKYNGKNVNFSVRDIIIVKRRNIIYTKKQVKTSPTLRSWADQRLVTNNMVFQHVKL